MSASGSPAGRRPSRLNESSSARVASFACCTFGSSNGLMPITAAAVAVASSHRTNSAPMASGPVHDDLRDRRAARGQRPHEIVGGRIAGVAAGEPHADDHAGRRRTRAASPSGSPGDRHDALALLPRGLGDELFDPEPERLERAAARSA